MFGLLILFGIIHSGGAAFRKKAESFIGARCWRVIFACVSIPSAVLLIGFFLPHRYDGIRLWNLQGVPGISIIISVLTGISFLFLYPATYNLLEIPAIQKPEIRLYSKGIIRISRHPQAIGQILWCISHSLWIGTSFMLVTSCGLIGHHIFAIWHGDRRLQEKFGEAFERLKEETSIIPFLAIAQGKQKFVLEEFLRPSQLGIAIAIGVLWWSHRFITLASETFLSSQLGKLLS